jgi:hypothetical protein
MPRRFQLTLDDLAAMQAPSRRGAMARLAQDPEALAAFARQEGTETPMGLLARLGYYLDLPARGVRSVLTGKAGASTKDLAMKLGIRGAYNPPGLDFGDVGEFGAALATDPLTYLGGIGGYSKLGKVAARTTGLVSDLKALQRFKRLTSDVALKSRYAGEFAESLQKLRAVQAGARQQFGRTVRPLAPTYAEQAAQGHRQLLSFGLPFTKPEIAVRGRPILEAAGKAARWAKMTPVAQSLGKAFVPKFGLTPEAKSTFDLAQREMRGAPLEAAPLGAKIAVMEKGVLQKTGMDKLELRKRLRDFRESAGKPEELSRLTRDVSDAIVGAKELAGREGINVWREKLKLKARNLIEERKGQLGILKARHEEARRWAPKRASEIQTEIDELTQGLDPQEVLAGLVRKTPFSQKDIFHLTELQRKAAGKFEPRIEQLLTRNLRAQAALKALPEEARPIAELIHKNVDDLLGEEILSGARRSENVLQAESIAYAERSLSPEAREYLRKKNLDRDFKAYLTTQGARAFSTKTPSQIRRREDLYEEFTTAASDFFKDKLPDFQGDWFDLNPATSVALRVASGKVSAATGKLWQTLIQNSKVPLAKAPDGIPIEDFAARGPLHALGRFESLPKSPFGIAKLISGERATGWVIPKDIAQEALHLYEKISGPEPIGKLLRVYDAVHGTMQRWLTRPFPGFYMRNLFSDTVLNWIGDAADPRFIAEALSRATDPKWLKEGEFLGIFRGDRARVLAKSLGRTEAEGAILDLGKPGVAEKILNEPKGLGQALKQKGDLVETFSRTWHFLSKKAQGMTDLEAARSVRKWLLDYSEITDLERAVFKRAFFFWNWPRKIIPLMLRSYFEKPSKMSALTRGTTGGGVEPGERGPVPEFIRQSAAIPVGKLGAGTEGYITGTGSPLEELNRLDITSPEGGAAGAVKKLGTQVGRQLSPILKGPIEAMTGHELFYDRPIIQSDKAEPILRHPGLKQIFGIQKETLPEGGTRYRGDPYMLHLLRLTPASRMLRELGQAENVAFGTNPQRSRLSDAARTLLGARVTPVDPLDKLRTIEEIQRRQGIKLQREGKLGQIPVLFARSLEGQKDPKAQALLKRNSALRQLMKAYRERQEAKSP